MRKRIAKRITAVAASLAATVTLCAVQNPATVRAGASQATKVTSNNAEAYFKDSLVSSDYAVDDAGNVISGKVLNAGGYEIAIGNVPKSSQDNTTDVAAGGGSNKTTTGQGVYCMYHKVYDENNNFLGLAVAIENCENDVIPATNDDRNYASAEIFVSATTDKGLMMLKIKDPQKGNVSIQTLPINLNSGTVNTVAGEMGNAEDRQSWGQFDIAAYYSAKPAAQGNEPLGTYFAYKDDNTSFAFTTQNYIEMKIKAGTYYPNINDTARQSISVPIMIPWSYNDMLNDEYKEGGSHTIAENALFGSVDTEIDIDLGNDVKDYTGGDINSTYSSDTKLACKRKYYKFSGKWFTQDQTCNDIDADRGIGHILKLRATDNGIYFANVNTKAENKTIRPLYSPNEYTIKVVGTGDYTGTIGTYQVHFGNSRASEESDDQVRVRKRAGHNETNDWSRDAGNAISAALTAHDCSQNGQTTLKYGNTVIATGTAVSGMVIAMDDPGQNGPGVLADADGAVLTLEVPFEKNKHQTYVTVTVDGTDYNLSFLQNDSQYTTDDIVDELKNQCGVDIDLSKQHLKGTYTTSNGDSGGGTMGQGSTLDIPDTSQITMKFTVEDGKATS